MHNRTRYLAGCRCEVCKSAQSVYRRELSARKAAGKPVRPVLVQMPSQDVSTVDGESVEAAVGREIGMLDTSKRPGLVATAIALARILDTRSAMAQHASAAGKLAELLAELSSSAPKKRSKLAELREAT
ncbi:hypothetical protein [Rhodococcus jostii]|uniref:hypothetical protein n=1 Tax=Rhodococcus jostii TaxID=132919 RepID=UPI00364830EF